MSWRQFGCLPLLSYAPVDAELKRKTKEHNEQAHRALSALQDEMSSQQVCVQQVLKELILCNESRPLCLDGHFEAEKARLLSELAAAGGQQSSLMSIVQDYIHTSFWMMAHESRPEVAGGEHKPPPLPSPLPLAPGHVLSDEHSHRPRCALTRLALHHTPTPTRHTMTPPDLDLLEPRSAWLALSPSP